MSDDPYRYFRVEAHDLLADLHRALVELERGGPAAPPIRTMLRAAHTLKSAARIVRLRDMGDVAHAIEDEVAPHRDLATPLAASVVERVASQIQTIATGLAAIDAPAPSPADATPAAAARVHDEPMRVVRADLGDVDELVEELGTVHVELVGLRATLGDVERAARLAELLAARLTTRVGDTAGPAGAGPRALAESLREVIAVIDRRVTSGVERLGRELGQARDRAERLRLVPASVLIEALERTVHDAARELGRRVELRAHGGEIRLDAHVLALAQGALVQIVRNAVAHGLEPEAERRASGKTAEGHVVVRVMRRGSRVVFSCSDDGRGVDLEAVRRAARKKGLLGSGEGTERSAAELLRLLLHGGLSTSASINAIAGRGVGMDIVRDAAERLGGEVFVRTEARRGTEIELSVPNLLSGLDVLVVEAGAETVAIAAVAVRGTRRIGRGDVVRTAESETILVDGRAVPFAPLAVCLGTAERAATLDAASAVLVVVGEEEAAIGVDRLRGLSHVLVRPVPDLVPQAGLAAGVALDAAGDPLVVIDAAGLVARARNTPLANGAARTTRPILVVDDSLTTRMLEQSILESAGYVVDLAVSGEEALEKLARSPYALMLVDVEMPGIDGFEVVTRVRADPRLATLPTILVTSRDAPADRARGREVGATEYVVKGEFDQSFLLGRIRELLA